MDQGPSSSKKSSPANARKPKPRPKKYLCPEPNCEKAYSRPCLLEQHLRSHTDERPFVCTTPGCGKAFLRDSHLKTHMLSHSVEKPLYCSFCGKGFNTNQHLNRHERTHVPSIKCSYEGCTEAFRRNSQLRKHVSECHTFRKQFVCPTCPREFDVKSRLDSHFQKCHARPGMSASVSASVSAVSTPVGAYHCGIDGCMDKFAFLSDLQSHTKYVHKRHGCNVCGKIFDTELGLEEHSKEHIGEPGLLPQEWHCREVQCEGVVLPFSDKHGLISHYQQCHGYVPETLQVQVHTPVPGECLPPLSALADQQLANGYPHVPQQALPTAREPLYKSLVTAGYDANRRIECPVDGCGYRFVREYDMKRHAKAVHPSVVIDDLLPAKPLPESPAVVRGDQFVPAGAAVPKFKFYIPPTSLTPRSDLSPASNPHIPLSSSSSPPGGAGLPLRQAVHEDIDVPALDQQQQLPSLSHYHPQQQQQQQQRLPPFDPASMPLVGGSAPHTAGAFDFMTQHDMALTGFQGVPVQVAGTPQDMLGNDTQHQRGAQGGRGGMQHAGMLQQYQGHQYGHQQPNFQQPPPPQQQQRVQVQVQVQGEQEIDPMIVNGSV